MNVYYGFRPLPGTYISQWTMLLRCLDMISFRPLPGTYISQFLSPSERPDELVSVPYRGLIFLNKGVRQCMGVRQCRFPSPTGDLYFSIPSPQFLVNTDCITQFAWEMIFQKYKFIFHYKKLSKCLFYAVRGKTNIF